MRQNIDVAMIGRVIAPPAFPRIVWRPWPARGREHVATQNPRADIVKRTVGEIIVWSGLAAVLAENLALEALCRVEPLMQRGPANAERIFQTLLRPRAEPIERNGKSGDA